MYTEKKSEFNINVLDLYLFDALNDHNSSLILCIYIYAHTAIEIVNRTLNHKKFCLHRLRNASHKSQAL